MKALRKMLLMSGKENSDKRGENGGYGKPKDQFRNRKGREYDEDGRYASARDGEQYRDREYSGPYYPSISQNDRLRNFRGSQIGFAIDGRMEPLPNYHHKEYPEERYRQDEMSYRKGEHLSGYAVGGENPPLTQEDAEKWAKKMENEDGTKGPHWTMEQTKQIQSQHNIDSDPLKFYLAMNMMYSDYVKVAKKLSVNNVEFYACMAQAFLDDKDAGPDKLAKYYYYIVSQ